jgi:hypothetical protein
MVSVEHDPLNLVVAFSEFRILAKHSSRSTKEALLLIEQSLADAIPDLLDVAQP